MSWRSSVAAAAVVAAAAAAVVAAGIVSPRPVEPRELPQARPATSATLSCPASPGASGAATSVFAVGPDTGAVSTRASNLRLAASTPSTAPSIAQASTLGAPVRATLAKTSGLPNVDVTAEGALAVGATAAQLSTDNSKKASGTAASWCLASRDEWWFSGVDTSIGTTTGLVLTNPSAGVAVVDLQVFSPKGPVDMSGADGIALAPGSRQVLDLARFAPGHAALTLHITATRGTVTAAISTARLDGVTPTGSEWVPATAAPADSVVVDAGVSGADRQSLVLTNPGTRQLLVDVRVLDKDGAFTSTALPDVQVPPGSVVVEDISSITLKEPTAIELSAAAPVTGAIVSELSHGTRDFAVSGVGDYLGAPAVVPTMPGLRTMIAFATSGPAPEEVALVTVDSAGDKVATTQVLVHGGATTTWTVPAAPPASYVVVTVPGGSRVSAVASYSGPAGITQLPVRSGLWTVLRPVVLPEP